VPSLSGVRHLLRSGLVIALLAGAPSVLRAEQPDSAAPNEGPKLEIGGFVDVCFAWNANQPDVVHGAEPRGPAAGPEVWRQVMQASVQWQTDLGRGLLLEAGVYPSHIGLETLATRDNWNYTHSWLGELSPYYQAGLKLAYPFTEHWSAQLQLLNGWQLIADNNSGKSVGAQLAYSAARVSFSLTPFERRGVRDPRQGRRRPAAAQARPAARAAGRGRELLIFGQARELGLGCPASTARASKTRGYGVPILS